MKRRTRTRLSRPKIRDDEPPRISRAMKIALIVTFSVVAVLIIFLGVLYGVDAPPATYEKQYLGDPLQYPPADTVHVYMAMDQKYKAKIGYKGVTINENYCKKWGFTFDLFDNLDESKLVCKNGLIKDIDHPQGGGFRYSRMFLKILGALELLAKTKENEILIYLDGDAWCVEHDRDLRAWIPAEPETYFLIGNEMESFSSNFPKIRMTIHHGIAFNAGFFLFRNNAWVKAFLERVMYTAYLKLPWHDQGIIGELFKNNLNGEQDHIRVIPHSFSVQHHRLTRINNPSIRTPFLRRSQGGRHPTALIWHQVNFSADNQVELFFTYEGRVEEGKYLEKVDPTLKPITKRLI